MDIENAQRLIGARWQIAKLGALVCFALAGGLMVATLARAPAADVASVGERGPSYTSAHR